MFCTALIHADKALVQYTVLARDLLYISSHTNFTNKGNLGIILNTMKRVQEVETEVSVSVEDRVTTGSMNVDSVIAHRDFRLSQRTDGTYSLGMRKSPHCGAENIH